MNAIKNIIERASKLNGTVVLPDNIMVDMSGRVKLADFGIQVIDYTTGETLQKGEAASSPLEKDGMSASGTSGGDAASPLLDDLAKVYHEAWNAKEAKKPAEKQKLIDFEAAKKTLATKRIYFGGMMVKLGRVNGLVAGSIASTGDMLRAAFHTLGTQKGVKTASSCFIIDLKTPTESGDGVLAFGDCGVIPNPTAEQLVDIGLATAQSYRDLTGNEPRVAYLSFSTKGSAAGDLVEKVQKAVELARPKFAEAGIKMDGEMQFDAAIVPSVGKQKNPNGEIQGNANVFIFPDLQAGNIAYKVAQRIGGADAIGPNLQGLAKAMNDLSRGCSADDIVATVAVTMLQAQTK